MPGPSINTLPKSLLSKILLQCLPIYTAPRGCAGPTWKDLRRQERDCLRLVCKRWDAVVCLTPEFWTLIDVELYHKHGSIHLKPSCFAIILLWLTRSAQLPLDIILFIEDEGFNHLGMYQAMAEVLDLLWTSIHRWRTLKVHLSETSALFWSVRSLSRARMLEAIHFSNNIPDCLIETTIKAFGKLKALRTFSIDGLQVTSSRAMTAWMPLHQLTRLDVLLQNGCEEEGLNVLRECTSATWIRVDSLGDPEPDHTILNLSTTLIHLPNLKILELAGMRCQVTELLFLHCPNLQVLSISSGPKSDLGEIISGYIAERKQNHTNQLRVLRVAELLPEQLEPFLSDEAVASIPVVEVKMVGVGAHSLDVARSALGLTERGSSKDREKIKVLEEHSDLIAASAPITGWADPKVLVELDEYFSHEWTTPLNAELLHADGRAQ